VNILNKEIGSYIYTFTVNRTWTKKSNKPLQKPLTRT